MPETGVTLIGLMEASVATTRYGVMSSAELVGAAVAVDELRKYSGDNVTTMVSAMVLAAVAGTIPTRTHTASS